jgi:hypothetical protein
VLSMLLLEAVRVAAEVELVCTDLSIPAATMMPVPFIDNVDYVVRLLGPHFDVDVRQGDAGGASIIVRRRS